MARLACRDHSQGAAVPLGMELKYFHAATPTEIRIGGGQGLDGELKDGHGHICSVAPAVALGARRGA